MGGNNKQITRKVKLDKGVILILILATLFTSCAIRHYFFPPNLPPPDTLDVQFKENVTYEDARELIVEKYNLTIATVHYRKVSNETRLVLFVKVPPDKCEYYVELLNQEPIVEFARVVPREGRYK